MRVLITGSSSGIGKSTAELFIRRGHHVIGLDIREASIKNSRYEHYVCDVSDEASLPDIGDVNIVVNSAGVQGSADDIAVNLRGTINVTERYGFTESIKSILIIASASAHTGAEFPLYSASKGGLLSYTRNAAIRAAEYGATCNSLSPGGVSTELNRPVMDDPELWNRIMEVTPLRKWASADEIAEWIYFMTAINRSCTGEDILIDNGETHLNASFIWPDN